MKRRDRAAEAVEALKVERAADLPAEIRAGPCMQTWATGDELRAFALLKGKEQAVFVGELMVSVSGRYRRALSAWARDHGLSRIEAHDVVGGSRRPYWADERL